jgi:hypothetical protein
MALYRLQGDYALRVLYGPGIGQLSLTAHPARQTPHPLFLVLRRLRPLRVGAAALADAQGVIAHLLITCSNMTVHTDSDAGVMLSE